MFTSSAWHWRLFFACECTQFYPREMFMLLRGLTWLVLLQLCGTLLNVLFLPMLPGPIIGMLLLFGCLLLRGEVGEPLTVAASGLLRYLPLLLVPAAVGAMTYVQVLAADFWAIIGALSLSLLLSLAFAGWLMQKLIERQNRRAGDA
jgi:holin-like protein